jgi:hypothetical protein
MRPTLNCVWRLFWLFAALAWVVIGVLFVAEGDTLARGIGLVFLAAWIAYAVRVYRRPRTKAELHAAGEHVARIYRRSLPILRHPLLRLAAAAVILVATLAGAAYLHWHQAVYHCPPESLVLCSYTKKPGWADPTALAIVLVGIAAAAGLLVTARRARDR